MLKFIFLSLLFYNYSLADELNLFTSRHYEGDNMLFNQFTDKTGIKVNVVSGKSKVLEKRILEEGEKSKADILFLADAGALYSSQSKGLFTKLDQKRYNFISKSLRNDYWVGITKRARILFYNPNVTSVNEIKGITYENLADKKWDKAIAIRQSNNIYNQSLVASILEHNGERKTKKWLNGFVKNFARSPQGNDRAQILMVASGKAKLAVANSYYYSLMLSGIKGDNQKKAAEKVLPIFPNQNGRGTHINISGAGILKFSPNKENALKFLDFLLTEKSQLLFCNNSFEFSVLDNLKSKKIGNNLNDHFKEDHSIDVTVYGKRQTEAYVLMKKAGWN